MLRGWKFGLLGGVLMLAGCADGAGVFSGIGGSSNIYAGYSPVELKDCNIAAANNVAQADWGKVQTIQVNIRDELFSPSILRLRPNQPYRIRFVNADNWFRSFQAEEFFRASAVRRMSFGGKEIAPTCTPTITIGANSSAEIDLLPIKEGRYRWAENPAIGDFVWARGRATGAIVVR